MDRTLLRRLVVLLGLVCIVPAYAHVEGQTPTLTAEHREQQWDDHAGSATRAAPAQGMRTMTPEQHAEFHRKMREHWQRMPSEERQQMEERLREYQAQRFWTPAS